MDKKWRVELLWVASINMNKLNGECKRGEIMKAIVKGKVDVLGVAETHLKGYGAWVI